MKGYTGISFPFRLGVKGGVAMSSTSPSSVPHIEESIQQILCTYFGERVMESDVGCDIDTKIFHPNTPSTHNIIKYEAVEALKKQEPRIKVDINDIIIESEGEYVFAYMTYEVISYGVTYSSKFYLGGVNNGK